MSKENIENIEGRNAYVVQLVQEFLAEFEEYSDGYDVTRKMYDIIEELQEVFYLHGYEQ